MQERKILAVRWRNLSGMGKKNWAIETPPIYHTTIYTSERQARQDIIVFTKDNPLVRPCGLGMTPTGKASIVLAYEFPVDRQSKLWQAASIGPAPALHPYETKPNAIHAEFAQLTALYKSEKDYPRRVIQLGMLLPPPQERRDVIAP
jgi:hypothetical protein